MRRRRRVDEKLTIELEERRSQRIEEVGNLDLLGLLRAVDLRSGVGGSLRLRDVGFELEEIVGIWRRRRKRVQLEGIEVLNTTR